MTGRTEGIFRNATTPGLGIGVATSVKSYIFASRLHGQTLRPWG